MDKLCVVGMALLALALGAKAQDVPRVEVFTGYSLVSAGIPFSPDPAAGTARVILNGWSVSATGNANRWFGVAADFGGYYSSATKTELFKPANCVLCTGNVNATMHNIYTFAGGPQVSVRQDQVNFFAHALFGGAHTRADLSGVGGSASISNTSFALIAGGGVDIGFSHRWALRLQPDYFMSSILDRRQNNFRFSTGVVFRFGQ